MTILHKLAFRETVGPILALLTSVSTLLCCALPALLITIGAGAAMASIASNVPGLIWLSTYKQWVFAIAGMLLIGTTYWKWHSRHAPCPTDPAAARACSQLRRWGLVVLIMAWLSYGVGGFFAFFAAEVLL